MDCGTQLIKPTSVFCPSLTGGSGGKLSQAMRNGCHSMINSIKEGKGWGGGHKGCFMLEVPHAWKAIISKKS